MLIRIAPYPFSIFNVLLSTTSFGILDFVLATAISLFKSLLHIYIGSKLESFGKRGSITFEEIIFLVLSSILGMGTMWLLYSKVRDIGGIRDEDEEIDLEV